MVAKNPCVTVRELEAKSRKGENIEIPGRVMVKPRQAACAVGSLVKLSFILKRVVILLAT